MQRERFEKWSQNVNEMAMLSPISGKNAEINGDIREYSSDDAIVIDRDVHIALQQIVPGLSWGIEGASGIINDNGR